jgi:DNA-binding transcriptional ArsR family regulator
MVETIPMLAPLLGSQDLEKALMYLLCLDEGYPRQMARFSGSTLSALQKQLDRLESAGVVYSQLLGRTRLYRFNPRYPFLKELKALLEKALTFYPEAERRALLMSRQRPRRAGKPL